MSVLSDFAYIERAKKSTVYPPHTFGIQLSATKGQAVWFEGGGKVNAKYAIVVTNPDKIKPKFLYYIVKNTMDCMLPKIRIGLNIQLDEIKKYPIDFTAEKEPGNEHKSW